MIFCISVLSQTGTGYNARSMGLAFSSAVTCSGIDACEINPANLEILYSEIKVKPRISYEFSILSVGGGYGSDSSIEFYNNYLKYLSINRATFVNLFTDLASVLNFRQNVLPSERTQINYDFALRWFSALVSLPGAGTFNISVTDKVGLNTQVNSRDEYLPLTFGFNMHNNGSYDLTDVRLSQSEAIAWWIRKYSIGYARKFNIGRNVKMSIGISASLVHGFGNITTYNSGIAISTWGIKQINGVNHIDSVKGKQNFHVKSALTDYFRDYRDGADEKFRLFPVPAGRGYSFDFGITINTGNWLFMTSLTEIGRINWNYNTIVNYDTNTFSYYNFYLSPEDPVYNSFVDDLGGYNTQDTSSGYYSETPMKLRVGIAFIASSKLLTELNWRKGFNNLPGNSDANIVSLCTEYLPLKFLPLRTGISLGGPGKLYISFGAGIKFKNFQLDLGTHGVNHLISNKRFSVSITTKFKI
jgi:hypothetical protein